MIRSLCQRHEVHGILLLDKPYGVSSNRVLQKVKYIYNANRAGHTGTLDPLATGMLPICFGEATKFSAYSLNSNKRYRVIAKLGQRTDTSDSDGQIIQEYPYPITFSKDQISSVLRSFIGEGFQVPSMYSAIKYQGKKLYEYARLGISVPRKSRPITIYKLLLIRYKGTELELEISCSKGTYIRTIIDDLGEKLGCGAHVTYLRRLAVGDYLEDKMVTLDQIQSLLQQAKEKKIPESKLLDPLLMPIDSPISNYPTMNLSLTSSFCFKMGHSVRTNARLMGLIRITEGKEKRFIGIGEINDKGYIFPRRLITNYSF